MEVYPESCRITKLLLALVDSDFLTTKAENMSCRGTLHRQLQRYARLRDTACYENRPLTSPSNSGFLYSAKCCKSIDRQHLSYEVCCIEVAQAKTADKSLCDAWISGSDG